MASFQHMGKTETASSTTAACPLSVPESQVPRDGWWRAHACFCSQRLQLAKGRLVGTRSVRSAPSKAPTAQGCSSGRQQGRTEEQPASPQN